MITVINQTPFVVRHREGGRPPPTFSVLSPEPWSRAVQVVVKATFDVVKGSVVPASEQLPIVERSGETEHGYMEGDLAFEKDGVDLVVLATAYAPHGTAAREMQVGLRVGEVSQTYVVTGDREWKKRASSFKPTDPAPFTLMDLGYECAFGGTYTLGRSGELPFMRNPIGKGWTPNLAGIEFEGRPLANLEYADRRIVAPEQEVDPAGLAWYRMGWGFRMMQGLKLNDGSGPPQVLPRLWNGAHPDLILRDYPGGQWFRIEGMTVAGLFEFEVPRLPIALEHTLHGRPERLPAAPDTLCVLPSRERMFILARWMVPLNPADGMVDRILHIIPEASSDAFGQSRS